MNLNNRIYKKNIWLSKTKRIIINPQTFFENKWKVMTKYNVGDIIRIKTKQQIEKDIKSDKARQFKNEIRYYKNGIKIVTFPNSLFNLCGGEFKITEIQNNVYYIEIDTQKKVEKYGGWGSWVITNEVIQPDRREKLKKLFKQKEK